MAVSIGVGWLGVLVAIGFWGTWASPLKAKAVADSKVDTLVMQMYVSSSVFITGLIIAAFLGFKWTWWGMAGALIWVPTNSAIVLAIRTLGLGLTSGICAGTVTTASFVWGAAGTSLWGAPPCVMANPALAGVGIILLVVSVVGLSVYGSPPSSKAPDADSKLSSQHDATEIDLGEIVPASDAPSVGVTPIEVPVTPSASPDPPLSRGKHLLGMILTAIIGFVTGAFAVPIKMAQRSGVAGLGYIPSFGASSVIVTAVMLAGDWALRQRRPVMHWRSAGGPGVLSGFLWSGGFVGSVFASLSPLGPTIGFPLTQSAVLVAGLMAIVVFREVKGLRRILLFMAFGVLVVIAAAVLANYGQCKGG